MHLFILFGSTKQHGALTVLDTLAVPGSSRLIPHNAGDRWTGGVAGGALYGEEVHDAQWGDLTLELNPGSFSPRADVNRRRAAWCLLGLVLAELAAGALPLGSRGTRRLGQEFIAQLVCSWNSRMLTGMPSSASSVRSSCAE